MKKKNVLYLTAILFLLALGVGYYYHCQNMANLDSLSVETSTNRKENHLKTGYELLVKGNYLWIMTNNKVPYKASLSSLQKQIDKTISNHRFNPKSPFYGRKVKIIKKTAFLGKYTIITKELKLIFSKKDDGSYQSQDGTVWLKSVE